jgi:hypothetical protein
MLLIGDISLNMQKNYKIINNNKLEQNHRLDLALTKFKDSDIGLCFKNNCSVLVQKLIDLNLKLMVKSKLRLDLDHIQLKITQMEEILQHHLNQDHEIIICLVLLLVFQVLESINKK